MPDDQISVELTAKVDQLQAGLSEAVGALKEATEAMQESLGGLKESTEEAETTLKGIAESVKGILHIEEFNFLKEQAEMAFEAIKSGFESTIGKAEEFALANAKFAAMMGTTEEQAAGLSAALRGVGSSAQDFESMALRLQMRLNTNEQAMQQLGLKTRDANGELLSGKDLIDSAISAMGAYKSGTDQNAFALEVFGRRAADVYNVMRVGDEQVQHQIDIFNEMGVTMTGSGSDAEKLEEALNDLHTMVDALGIKIGQELMPAAQAALQWMGEEGTAFLKELAVGIAELGKAIAKWAEDAFKSISHVVEAWNNVSDVVDRISKISDEMDAASSSTQTFSKHTGEALQESWGHFTNAMKLVVGGPLEDAKNGITEQGAAADTASSAIEHLSSAWDTLLEGFGKIGKGGIAEQLGAVSGGIGGAASELANDPLVAALSKTNPFKGQGSGSKRFVAPKKGAKDNSAEEAIQSAEKIALARLQIEEQTNAHLLAMGQKSTDAFIAQETHVENERYNVERDGILKRMALPATTLAERSKLYDQLQLLDVQHEGKLEKIEQDGEKQRAEIAKESLRAFLDADNALLKSAVESLNAQVERGQITATERDQQEIQLTAQIRAEQLKRLDAEIAGLAEGSKAWKEATDQRKKLVATANADMAKANDKLWKDVNADVKQALGPVTSSFKTAVNSMIFEGKSFADAMAGLAKSVAQGFVEMAEQIAEKWLETELTNAAVATTTTQTAAVAQISANAGVAASGAAASQAGIPIIGPALAAGAAAAMIALVLGFEGLAHASGGMTLDRDQLVYAHKKEMILPAHLSQGIQNIINNGGPSSSQGGDTSLHYAPTIHSNQKGLSQLLQEESGAMLAWFAQASRDGKLKSRGP